MVRAQIVGATGYGGLGMIELLLRHPEVRLTSLLAKTDTGQPVSTLFPHLRGFCDLPVDDATPERVGRDADLVVFATPDRVAMEYAPALLQAGVTVIDYSGDFRFESESDYTRYAMLLPRGRPEPHRCPELLDRAVYGLPELFRKELAGARLIGNPGCFAVAMILGLTPLLTAGLVDPRSIVCDGKTGVSGAGKKPSAVHHFPERNENLAPYRVAAHQHGFEATAVLERVTGRAVGVTFVPHLLPVTRGILCTMYATLARPASARSMRDLYHDAYGREPFIRVLPAGAIPTLKGVVGSNLCDIGIAVDDANRRVVVIASLDNLLKGQAGVALQNINIRFGFPEATGLDRLPVFP